MKIDRSKVTPEMLNKMRETLTIAGEDHQEMTDEQIIQQIERILELMIEFCRIARQSSETVHAIVSFVESPAGQALLRIREHADEAGYASLAITT